MITHLIKSKTLFVALIILLSSCDPYTTGTIKVVNNSDYELRLYRDSSSQIIPPQSSYDVGLISEIGHPSNFDCCPCRILSDSIQAADTSLHLGRNIKEKEDWNLDNKNKTVLKTYPVICEFRVTNDDIK